MSLAALFPLLLVLVGDAPHSETWRGAIAAIVTVVTMLAAALGNQGPSRLRWAERLRQALLEVALRPSAWLVLLLAAAIAYQVRKDDANSDDAPAHARPATAPSTISSSDPAHAASTDDDWPVERGSNRRHARVGDAAGPRATAPRRRWRFGRSDEAFYGSPAIRGNVVYAVGSETRQARVVAVSLEDGKLIWSGGPSDYRPTFAGPVVVGSTLFAAEGLHSTRQARVFALDLRPRREGALRWHVATASHVECTPAVAEGRLYFNAGDDGVYGFHASLSDAWDAAPSPATRPLFHRPGGAMPDAETSLLVDGDRLYVGLGVGGQAVVQLDAATGDERRRLATPHPVFAPPALYAERLFVGMGGGDYTNPAQARAGALWRLDAATLDVVWQRELPATVLGAVIVDSTQVIVGCGDGRVLAYDHEGQVVARWNLGAPIAASLALTPDFLYGVTHSGQLFALDRRRQEVAWQVSLGRPGHYMSGPIIVSDQLVLGTPHEGLVCYGP
ncbi:MAG: PQQ-binding-like beta-propeller repeat protein [Pirellulales bacterium]